MGDTTSIFRLLCVNLMKNLLKVREKGREEKVTTLPSGLSFKEASDSREGYKEWLPRHPAVWRTSAIFATLLDVMVSGRFIDFNHVEWK